MVPCERPTFYIAPLINEAYLPHTLKRLCDMCGEKQRHIGDYGQSHCSKDNLFSWIFYHVRPTEVPRARCCEAEKPLIS